MSDLAAFSRFGSAKLPLVQFRFPSGKYGFVGSVPARLAYADEPEKVVRAREMGATQFLKTRVWDSRDAALADCHGLGFRPDQITGPNGEHLTPEQSAAELARLGYPPAEEASPVPAPARNIVKPGAKKTLANELASGYNTPTNQAKGKTPMTTFAKAQLTTILSALDGEPRRPANSAKAVRAIEASAARLGLTLQAIHDAAPALLDGAIGAAEWKDRLLNPPAPEPEPKVEPRKRAPKAPGETRPLTKEATLVEMLRRPGGATVFELMDATGWLRHSVRGAISAGLRKKLGMPVQTAKNADGHTVYRLGGAESEGVAA